MTDITIPDEVVEAAAKEVAEQLGDDWDDNVHTFCGDDWQLTPDGAKETCRSIARAAILAALQAWPGMQFGLSTHPGASSEPQLKLLILPLPTQETDA